MANHKYYKRLEFESKAMEEYEVRERYGRVTFPGKDIVRAWRDDAINPMISELESSALSLRSDRWSWNHFYGAFSGLKEIGKEEPFSANGEDFISRHLEVAELLNKYNAALLVVNDEGKVLFERVSKSSFIREAFALVTSEESLTKLEAENANRFKGTTARAVYEELFGQDGNEQNRFDYLAEWVINGAPQTNVQPMLIFWRAYGDRFYNLIVSPPLSEYRQNVQKARDELSEIGRSLLATLKKIRKELSETHNVAVQASGPDPGEYNGGLSVRPSRY